MRTNRKAEREAHKARMTQIHAENQAIVDTGKCPKCGSPLVRNITMSGWWQCAAYGAVGFRARFTGTGQSHPEYDSLPSCSFQTFTD